MDKDIIISEQWETIASLEETVRQLEKAIDIIGESNGDWLRELVYDTLCDVGYYNNTEDEIEDD